MLLITQILETSIPLKGERAERLFTPAPAAQLLKALRYPLDLWQSTADVQGDEYHIVLTRRVSGTPFLPGDLPLRMRRLTGCYLSCRKIMLLRCVRRSVNI